MRRVLVVDDDEQIQKSVEGALRRIGYDVECVSSATRARERVTTFGPALIILDIMLPGMSGIEFCKELRQTEDIPVIFLSGLDEDIDRIVGLEIGGDDYLTKPFHPGELVARVKAVLRRTEKSSEARADVPEDDKTLTHGPLTVDLDRHLVFVDEEPVELTRTEFRLLETLMRYPTRVYNRDELMKGAYGPGTYVSDRTIDSHIRRLRNKLGESGIAPIETVRGVGYRISREC